MLFQLNRAVSPTVEEAQQWFASQLDRGLVAGTLIQFEQCRKVLEWLQHHAPPTYRFVEVHICSRSFGPASSWRRKFLVAHPRSVNFNLSLPELQAFTPTVGDAICRDDFDPGTLKSMTANEKHWAKVMPYGKSLSEINRLHQLGYDIPNLRLYMRRLWPTLPLLAYDPTEDWTGLLHPIEERFITLNEIRELLGVSKVLEWCNTHLNWCATGAWGDRDYSSTYNYETGQIEE